MDKELKALREIIFNSTYSIKSFIITTVCNKEVRKWLTATIPNSTYIVNDYVPQRLLDLLLIIVTVSNR